ncbi:MAG: hypothetical protein ACRDWE_01790 [Acidimicrobiales bacterium]
MVETSSATRDEIAAAASSVASAVGIDWAYDLLDSVCDRHRLADAWLVLRPAPSNVQIFRRGRRPLPPKSVAILAQCPSGVFDPLALAAASSIRDVSARDRQTAAPRLDMETGRALGVLCEAAYRALVAQSASTTDPATGLLSRHAIAAALDRTAASAARYGWPSTVVLLSTSGDPSLGQHWPALAGALRTVIRSGDEAGVLAPGTAMAILGNVGGDTVRPFLARVRAELSAAGFDGVDLLVGTATAPRESVNPAELRRLALERLVEMGAAPPRTGLDREALELALRALPGVVWVAWPEAGAAPQVTVGAWCGSGDLELLVTRRVHEHFPGASVRVVDAGVGQDVVETHAGVAPDGTAARSVPVAAEPVVAAPVSAMAAAPNGHASRSNGHARGSNGQPSLVSPLGHGVGAAETRNGVPSALPAAASGDGEAAPTGGRVSFLTASFDAGRGMTEVTVGLGATRGSGQAAAGPLVGGAQATLGALAALGRDVPFYVVSADRALGVPGEPVVVVLGARHGADGTTATGERIGIASGDADADAASRATLGALNRYLSRPQSS